MGDLNSLGIFNSLCQVYTGSWDLNVGVFEEALICLPHECLFFYIPMSARGHRALVACCNGDQCLHLC